MGELGLEMLTQRRKNTNGTKEELTDINLSLYSQEITYTIHWKGQIC